MRAWHQSSLSTTVLTTPPHSLHYTSSTPLLSFPPHPLHYIPSATSFPPPLPAHSFSSHHTSSTKSLQSHPFHHIDSTTSLKIAHWWSAMKGVHEIKSSSMEVSKAVSKLENVEKIKDFCLGPQRHHSSPCYQMSSYRLPAVNSDSKGIQ